jgi:hypothetical protein
MRRFAILIPFYFALAGCLGYPLGMTEHEWRQISPTERADARRQQAEIDDARDARRARKELAERRRLEALYRDAPHGSLLQCVIEDGTMQVQRKSVAYEALGFSIVRGETKRLKLASPDASYDMRVALSLDGQKLNLCDDIAYRCQSVVAIGRDFEAGKRWTVDVGRLLKGATLRCAYPSKGPKSRPSRKSV